MGEYDSGDLRRPLEADSCFDLCLFTVSLWCDCFNSIIGAKSASFGSGEADDEPALRSRSSRRLFIFLPFALLA